MSRLPSLHFSLYFALLLGALHPVLSVPHGGETESAGGMAQGSMDMSVSAPVEWTESFGKPSYFRHPNYVFWIYAHIISMVLAWVIALPIGKSCSYCRKAEP
jgi:Isoprenylcysteine carboxyl methyltransferase (ICMT) family